MEGFLHPGRVLLQWGVRECHGPGRKRPHLQGVPTHQGARAQAESLRGEQQQQWGEEQTNLQGTQTAKTGELGTSCW